MADHLFPLRKAEHKAEKELRDVEEGLFIVLLISIIIIIIIIKHSF